MPGRGKAVIANADIPAGILIIAESPLLSISKRNESITGLNEAFQALDHDDLRKTYLNLHNAWPAVDRMKGVYKTNSILLGDSGRAGVFARICRINHSCSPNCVASWHSETSQLRIRSVLPISAGDEITFCYIDPLQARDARRLELLQRYNFLCRCSACIDDGVVEASDNRRVQARRFMEEGNTLGAFDSNDVTVETEAALRLLDAEKLVGPRFAFSSAAYEAALRLRKISLARTWAARAAEDAKLILGSGDERYRLFLQYANG